MLYSAAVFRLPCLVQKGHPCRLTLGTQPDVGPVGRVAILSQLTRPSERQIRQLVITAWARIVEPRRQLPETKQSNFLGRRSLVRRTTPRHPVSAMRALQKLRECPEIHRTIRKYRRWSIGSPVFTWTKLKYFYAESDCEPWVIVLQPKRTKRPTRLKS